MNAFERLMSRALLLIVASCMGCATTSPELCGWSRPEPVAVDVRLPMVGAKFSINDAGDRWWQWDLAYYFAEVAEGVNPPAGWRAAHVRQLAIVSGQTQFRFHEVFSRDEADIIFYQNRLPERTWLGHATYPPRQGSTRAAWMEMNWARFSRVGWQAEDTILHEILHLLGLDHSSRVLSKVRPGPGVLPRMCCGEGLCRDDLRGLAALYEN